MISESVVRRFFCFGNAVQNIDELGNGRLQAAEHLRDKDFLGRNRRKFLYAVFVEILLFEICALGNDLVRERRVLLDRLREHRSTLVSS